MRLVVIYGPPASGKLSVAKKLSEMTGYKLFHNHASLDFVGTLFKFGTPVFNRLVVNYRKEMLEEAARSGINTIFTSAWVKGYNPKVVRELKHIIEKHGGEVRFVYLYADRKELIRRAVGRSRRRYGKIMDRKQLIEFIHRRRFGRQAPIAGSLVIDNTHMSPKRAAETIAEHYGIALLQGESRARNMSGAGMNKTKRIVYKNRILKVEEESGSRKGRGYTLYRVNYARPVVVILPVLGKNRILMEKQRRGVLGKYILEIPAGRANKGESFAACARRELREETGYSAGKIRPLLNDYPSPGMMSSMRHYFVATDLRKGKRSLEENEEIEIKIMKINDVIKLIKSRRITDSKTITAILFYRLLKGKS